MFCFEILRIFEEKSQKGANWKSGHRAPTPVKPQENLIFSKKGKMIIWVKIRNFSRSRMTKQTSPLESSREI